MEEQAMKILETLNLGIEPIVEAISKLMGVSVGFVEENFITAFYQSGRYLFWDKIIGSATTGLIIFTIFTFFVWGLSTASELDSGGTAVEGSKKGFIWSFKLVLPWFVIIFIISVAKDVVLYNTARELWIAEHLAETIQYFQSIPK